jgi:hypothetical protein
MPADSTPRPSRRQCRGLPRICQISEYHCGPAVLQMLLGRCGIMVDQQRLTELADVAATIEIHGTRIDQLARAVAFLREDVHLWYKKHASAADLTAVICRYGYPAGVEWQGFFEESEEDEDLEEGEYGHYSIVVGVDRRREQITLRDPYPEFCHEDRVFALNWFINRWWDVNLAPVRGRGLRPVEDRRLLFVIAGPRVRFPLRLGMTRA